MSKVIRKKFFLGIPAGSYSEADLKSSADSIFKNMIQGMNINKEILVVGKSSEQFEYIMNIDLFYIGESSFDIKKYSAELQNTLHLSSPIKSRIRKGKSDNITVPVVPVKVEPIPVEKPVPVVPVKVEPVPQKSVEPVPVPVKKVFDMRKAKVLYSEGDFRIVQYDKKPYVVRNGRAKLIDDEVTKNNLLEYIKNKNKKK